MKYINAEEKILKYLLINDFITTNIALDILELKSKSWVRDILKNMERKGKIKAEGQNKNRRYKLN